MAKFKHADAAAKRVEPDPKALEAFAAGAEMRTVTPPEGTDLRDSVDTGRRGLAPAKKITVMLDRERWLALKQKCAELDKSGQIVMVEALDLYLSQR